MRRRVTNIGLGGYVGFAQSIVVKTITKSESFFDIVKFCFETKLLFFKRQLISETLEGIGHCRCTSSKFFDSLATSSLACFYHRHLKLNKFYPASA